MATQRKVPNTRRNGNSAKGTAARWPDFDPVARQHQIAESIELHANGWSWRSIAAHQGRDVGDCYKDWRKALQAAVPDELAAEVAKVQLDRMDALIRTWLPLATNVMAFVKRDGKLVAAGDDAEPSEVIWLADKDAAAVVLKTEELRAKIAGTFAVTRVEVSQAPTAADLEAKLAAYLQGVKDTEQANAAAAKAEPAAPKAKSAPKKP